MAGEWWLAGPPIFSPHTLHQRARSSSRGGQGNCHHSPTLPLTILGGFAQSHAGRFAPSRAHHLGDFPSLVHLTQEVRESTPELLSISVCASFSLPRRELGKGFTAAKNFLVQGPFTLGVVCVCASHTNFSGKCMSPY